MIIAERSDQDKHWKGVSAKMASCPVRENRVQPVEADVAAVEAQLVGCGPRCGQLTLIGEGAHLLESRVEMSGRDAPGAGPIRFPVS
ncbi:MAG TPA: hypothetical protein DEP84_06255 [Chloroflexi bacterium]|nr:hypothetical protein [Chloroflexota bacterium]